MKTSSVRRVLKGPVGLTAMWVLGGSVAVWGGDSPSRDRLDVEAREAAGLENAGLESAGLQPVSAPSIGYLFAAIDGAVVPVTVIVMDGDRPPGAGGSPIVDMGPPAMDRLGRLGMTGGITSDNYVWYDDDVAFVNGGVMTSTLSGAEGSMGVADDGSFFFSPSIDGSDGVWSDNGLVAVEDVQAPGFPVGTNSTFHSRPSMIPTGQAYWVAGFNETGGTSSEGRVLYTSPTASSGDITVVLRSDDRVGGFVIARPSGIGFDYDFSTDGQHHIQELTLVTGTATTDGGGGGGSTGAAIYVDGAIVAREGLPLPAGGGNWDNFDQTAINNDGHYLFGGDTDEATTLDEFIAYDGVMGVREGDTVGGVALATPAAVRGLAINDRNQAAHAWSADGLEVLFAACDASDLTDGVLLLAVGDGVDVDGDGMADATVVDFETSSVAGNGLALSNAGIVAIEVELDDGTGPREAMLTLATGCLDTAFADGFESGDTSAWTSTVP